MARRLLFLAILTVATFACAPANRPDATSSHPSSAVAPSRDPSAPSTPSTSSTSSTAAPTSVAGQGAASPPSSTPEPPPLSQGLYAWEHPLPDGFVSIPDPRQEEQGEASCMGLTVRNVWTPDQPGTEPSVQVTDAKGAVVYRARGRLYTLTPADPRSRMSLVADYCGDLTGDGVPELVLTERSMGAHCCYTHYVVSLTRPATTLLMWEKGDAGGGIVPVEAEPGKGYQLLSNVVTFPPFDEDHAIGVSYAGAPLIPILFELVGTQYRARTFRYADFLKEARKKSLAGCERRPECEPNELLYWGVALVVGDWEQQRGVVSTEPYILEAMNATSVAFRKQLERDLGR